jgi:UDP-N-acetylmuramoyl-tripeptide--D-alanyl-D-alanine ligase
MNTEELYKIFESHPKISTDTRKIEPNCIFFALKGTNFDGNQFAHEALQNGASYIVVDDPQVQKNKNTLLVDNVLASLQALANHHRKKLGTPILAITGSNGKTTTKELINKVLSVKYRTIATQGNLNNHIGVPLTLLCMTDKTDFGIVEMGANHIGEIANLCEIAAPNFGIITNIGKAHIEGFGSFEGIIKAKTELYQYLATNKGSIFCNAGNEILNNHANKMGCPVAYYGNSNSGIWLEINRNNPYLSVIAHVNEWEQTINSNLIGSYNLENINAAIAIGHYFGIDLPACASAIANYIPSNLRSQWKKTNRNHVIVDAYNANPTSMALAIDNFFGLNFSNKLLILGDMLETGAYEDDEHKAIIQKIESSENVKAILIGPVFNKWGKIKNMESYRDVQSFIDSGQISKILGQNILLKGSRGIGLEKLLDHL